MIMLKVSKGEPEYNTLYTGEVEFGESADFITHLGMMAGNCGVGIECLDERRFVLFYEYDVITDFFGGVTDANSDNQYAYWYEFTGDGAKFDQLVLLVSAFAYAFRDKQRFGLNIAEEVEKKLGMVPASV